MQISASTFIVSGGASGLGEATARRLVSQGGRVVIADLNEARGQQLACELGERAVFVKTDVTDEDAVKAAVAAAAEPWGFVCVWPAVPMRPKHTVTVPSATVISQNLLDVASVYSKRRVMGCTSVGSSITR